MRRAAWTGILVAVITTGHPMGNFSVSHYTRFTADPGGRLRIQYALDLAEIPSFELARDRELPAQATHADLAAAAQSAMADWVGQLELRISGQPVALRPAKVQAVVTDGAGGMPVVRAVTVMTVDLPAGPAEIEYRDQNFAGRAGWKEIVVDEAAALKVRSRFPDRSQALTAYPADPATAPPQESSVQLTWHPTNVSTDAHAQPGDVRSRTAPPLAGHARPGETKASSAEPPVSPVPPGSEGSGLRRGDFLSTLLSRQDLSWDLALLGVGAAFLLGATHALSPGHGKTLVAAYLVGSRGTLGHAALLGAMVTFTHTITVFLLGLATLFLSRYVLPEKIVPWLGAISGLSIVALGFSLFRRRLAKLLGRDWGAGSGQHSHGGFVHSHDAAGEHDHGDGPHHHHLPEEISLPGLVALGVSGGLVPCPSALVLLLSAMALGRTGYGLVLLVGFSLGLALVLMGIGMLVLYAKSFLPQPARWVSNRWVQAVPVLSALVIVGVGVVLTGASIGVFKPLG